ncbi:hypothetical protein [Streptomyces sp.]|uniref:hypothetical protein n=1 Tax=Streptomyces sp. TaxID=1931 RepID=UPI002F3FF8B1
MRTRTSAAALVLSAGLLAAGCGAVDGEPVASPSASASAATVAASPSTSASSAPATAVVTATAGVGEQVKVSVEWGPKLLALGDRPDADACQMPGSFMCQNLLTAHLNAYTGVIEAISEADAGDRYRSSVEQIERMVADARGYDADGCAGDPSAGDDDSSCEGYATGVLIGALTLKFDLETDELKAGLG